MLFAVQSTFVPTFNQNECCNQKIKAKAGQGEIKAQKC